MSSIVRDFFREVREIEHIRDQEGIEDELTLLNKAQKGDDEAREQLIETNIRLVITIANYYKNISNIEFIDLIQEGVFGIDKAIDRFDVKSGNKFSTYATWWIRDSITRYITNNSRTIRIPSRKVEMNTKYLRIKEELLKKTGVEPSNEEVAEKMKVNVEDIELILEITQPIASLDKKLEYDDGTGHTTLSDIIESKEDRSVEDNTLTNIQIEKMKEGVYSVLTEEERFVLMSLYGIPPYDKLRKVDIIRMDIGYNNPATVTKVERDAMKKLHAYIENERYNKYL